MKRLDLITKAINIAITQNSHDMIMTGDELRVCAQALVAAFELRELELVGQTQASSALPSTSNQVATCVCPKCLRMRNE